MRLRNVNFVAVSLWLGACQVLSTVVAGEDPEGAMQVIVASKAEDVPARCRRIVAKGLEKCAAGYKLRVTLGKFYDFGHSSSTNQFEPYVHSMVPLNAKGRPDGEEQFFHINSSWVKRTVPYVDGKREGIEKHYEGRKVTVEVPWHKDRVHGVRKMYHPNGKVRSESVYVKGLTEGPTRSYTPEGKVTRESTMRKGKRDGVMTDYWPETGKPKRVIPYDKGKVDGVVREYYRNGQLKREMIFKDDVMHGIEKQYEADGTLVRTRYWKDDDRVSEEEFRGK